MRKYLSLLPIFFLFLAIESYLWQEKDFKGNSLKEEVMFIQDSSLNTMGELVLISRNHQHVVWVKGRKAFDMLNEAKKQPEPESLELFVSFKERKEGSYTDPDDKFFVSNYRPVLPGDR